LRLSARLGEQGAEILSGLLGLAPDDIDGLVRSGVVKLPG
jgi:hypothetical protein